MNLPLDYWDRSRALEGVGGDEEFLRELAGIFCAAYPTLLKSLKESISAKDHFRAAETAHLLASTARNLTANRAREAALAVEMMSRRKEFDDIDNAFYTLRQEGGKLVDALLDFMKM